MLDQMDQTTNPIRSMIKQNKTKQNTPPPTKLKQLGVDICAGTRSIKEYIVFITVTSHKHRGVSNHQQIPILFKSIVQVAVVSQFIGPVCHGIQSMWGLKLRKALRWWNRLQLWARWESNDNQFTLYAGNRHPGLPSWWFDACSGLTS